MVFVAKVSRNSYSSVTVDSLRVRAIFARGARVEVTRTKFFVVNGTPYFFNGIYSYLLNRKDSGIMKGIIRRGRAQGLR